MADDRAPGRRSMRFGGGLAVIAGIGLALRWWLIAAYRPICPQLNTPGQGRCFNVAGDALYAFWQGRLITLGHWWKDPVAWFLEERVLRESAGKAPLHPLTQGLMGWVGLESPGAQRGALMLFGVVTIVVVGLVGRHLGGARCGLIAAGLAAVAPALWINDMMMQVEPLSTLVVALVLLSAYRTWARPTWASALCLAGLLAVGAMLRPEMQFMLPTVLLPAVLCARQWAWRRRIAVAGAGLGLAALIWSPWLAWNQTRFEAASPWAMTTSSGAVLSSAYCDVTYGGEALGYWAANCFRQPRPVTVRPGETVGAAVDRITGDPAITAVLVDGGAVTLDGVAVRTGGDTDSYVGRTLQVDVRRDLLDESQYYAVAQQQAVTYARGHLARLPVVMAARVGRMLNLYRPFDTIRLDATVEGRGRTPTRLALWSWWAGLPLAAWGAVLLRRRSVTLWPMAGVCAVVIASAAMSFGVMRYRVPIDLCVLLLVAVSLDHLWSRWAPGGRATMVARDGDDNRAEPSVLSSPAP